MDYGLFYDLLYHLCGHCESSRYVSDFWKCCVKVLFSDKKNEKSLLRGKLEGDLARVVYQKCN